MKTLYPEIDPFQCFFLKTGGQHDIYVEQSGNRKGLPVIFLHGGPCSGTRPDQRRFFNPQKYHIILMDQRACGQSMPFGEITANTTQDLIDDIERIRQQLEIPQWVLFGGSWGGALALLYAQQHTSRVAGMIIRGVFLARQCDLDWFVKDGVRRIFPEKWQQLMASLPDGASRDPVQAMYDTVFGEDELSQRRAARAWVEWGGQVALMREYRDDDKLEHVSEQMLKQVQMEIHYAQKKYFIAENQILDHCARLKRVPTSIIHGRYDLVCPLEAGLSLANALPHAQFTVLPNAGHIASGKEMINALVEASDQMITLLQ